MRSPILMPLASLSLITALGPDRDIGTSLSFSRKLSKQVSLSLVTGLFNGAGINASDSNTHKNVVARAEVTIANMITLAPNLYTGKVNSKTSPKNLDSYGGSAAWNWKTEMVEFEYIQSRVSGVTKAGWYLTGGHTIPTKWALLPEVQLVTRYEQYDADVNLVDNRVNRLSFGTNLFVDKKYTEIQITYQINGEQGTKTNNNEILCNLQVAF